MGDEGEHLMPEGYINTSELYREGSETQEVEENLNPMGFFGMHLHVKKTFTHGQDGDLEETEGRHRSKSFIEVIVDKLGGGGTTIASSVYNLSATSIGAGVLSLPYVLKIGGFGIGLLFLFGGALTAIWSLYILLKTAEVVKAKNFSLVCEKAGGKKLSIFLEVALLVLVFGIIAVYQIIATQLTNKFLDSLGVSSSIIDSTGNKILQPIIWCLVVIFPLCIMRDISSLSYASLLSIITIAYTTLVIVIEMPFYFNQNYSSKNMKWFIINWDTLDAFAMTFLAYANQTTFFSIYEELSSSSAPRMKKVIHASVIANVTLYVFISLFGYLSTFDNTPPVVITRDKLSYFNRDYFMIFGILGVIITIVISIPINYTALRRSFYNLFISPKAKIKNPLNLIITSICLVVTTTIAITFPKIRSMFSILGGFCAVIVCFIVPSLCYILAVPGKLWKFEKLTTIILCLIFSFMGIGSAVRTVIKVINGNAIQFIANR